MVLNPAEESLNQADAGAGRHLEVLQWERSKSRRISQLDGGSGDESDSSNHEEVVQMLLQPGPPVDIGTVVPSPVAAAAAAPAAAAAAAAAPAPAAAAPVCAHCKEHKNTQRGWSLLDGKRYHAKCLSNVCKCALCGQSVGATPRKLSIAAGDIEMITDSQGSSAHTINGARNTSTARRLDAPRQSLRSSTTTLTMTTTSTSPTPTMLIASPASTSFAISAAKMRRSRAMPLPAKARAAHGATKIACLPRWRWTFAALIARRPPALRPPGRVRRPPGRVLMTQWMRRRRRLN